MGGAHSPPRRGGVARSAGVVSSAKRCAGLTTPAAPLRSLRDILLMAQPPLLCEEGKTSYACGDFREMGSDRVAFIDERHDKVVRRNVIKVARMDEDSISFKQTGSRPFFIVRDWNREIKASLGRNEGNPLQACQSSSPAL